MRWKQGTTVLLVGTALVGGVLMPGAGADSHGSVDQEATTTVDETTTTIVEDETITTVVEETTTTTVAAPTTTTPIVAPTTTTTIVEPSTTTTLPTTTTTTLPTTTTTTLPTTTTTTTLPTTTTTPEPEPVDICGGSPDAFEDDGEGLLYEESINCLFRYGLVVGVNDTEFQPNVLLRREQAATILVNYVEETEDNELVVRDAGFTDIAGSVHEENINKGFGADIINGYTDNTFRPTTNVSREQFVTLLVQSTEALLGEKLTTDAGDRFSDDEGSVHEENLEKAHDNGLLEGIPGDPNDGRKFVVRANVTRGEAAHMMANALSNVLAPAGVFTP